MMASWLRAREEDKAIRASRVMMATLFIKIFQIMIYNDMTPDLFDLNKKH